MIFLTAKEKKLERKLYMKVTLKRVYTMVKDTWSSLMVENTKEAFHSISSVDKVNLLVMMV